MRSQKIREVSFNGVTPSNIFFFSKNPPRGLLSNWGGRGSNIWGGLSPRDHLGSNSNTYANSQGPGDAPEATPSLQTAPDGPRGPFGL